MKFSISLGIFLQMSQPHRGFWVLWNGDVEQWGPGTAHKLYQNLPDESIPYYNFYTPIPGPTTLGEYETLNAILEKGAWAVLICEVV